MTNRSVSTRRAVLLRVLPAVPCCVAYAGPPAVKHKFARKFDLMTWEETFRFFYKSTIRYMKGVAEHIGREKLVEILLDVTLPRVIQPPKKYYVASFEQFKKDRKSKDPWTEVPVTRKFVEESDQVLAYEIRECLYARVFREEAAGDIGYAMLCHADFATARKIHPRVKLVRTKTLMQGHDCCDFRWEWSEAHPR